VRRQEKAAIWSRRYKLNVERLASGDDSAHRLRSRWRSRYGGANAGRLARKRKSPGPP
jgi:hypothetical protein